MQCGEKFQRVGVGEYMHAPEHDACSPNPALPRCKIKEVTAYLFSTGLDGRALLSSRFGRSCGLFLGGFGGELDFAGRA